MIPRFSKRFERDSSGLESLFTLSEKKDAISFAGGYPAEETPVWNKNGNVKTGERSRV